MHIVVYTVGMCVGMFMYGVIPCVCVCVCIISESNTERKICFFPYFIIIHVHGKVQLFSVNS